MLVGSHFVLEHCGWVSGPWEGEGSARRALGCARDAGEPRGSAGAGGDSRCRADSKSGASSHLRLLVPEAP